MHICKYNVLNIDPTKWNLEADNVQLCGRMIVNSNSKISPPLRISEFCGISYYCWISHRTRLLCKLDSNSFYQLLWANITFSQPNRGSLHSPQESQKGPTLLIALFLNGAVKYLAQIIKENVSLAKPDRTKQLLFSPTPLKLFGLVYQHKSQILRTTKAIFLNIWDISLLFHIWKLSWCICTL